jgi:hypothetical protein
MHDRVIRIAAITDELGGAPPGPGSHTLVSSAASLVPGEPAGRLAGAGSLSG